MPDRRVGQTIPIALLAKRLAVGIAVLAAFAAANTVSAVRVPHPGPVPLPTRTASSSGTMYTAGQPLSAPVSANLIPFPTPTPNDAALRAIVVLDEDGRRWSRQTLPLNAYYWMLLSWSSNSLKCQIYIAHEGPPNADEIEFACGEKVYSQWLATPGCSSSNTRSCKGLYLHFAGRQSEEVTQVMELPKPVLEISSPDCQPYLPCDQRPSLLFSARESLPGYKILSIHYRIAGDEYACQGSYCQITLPLTTDQGAVVEAWAESSLGDSSLLQRLRVRTYQLAAAETPFQFDALSELWPQLAPSCSLGWDRFPPINPSAHIWLEQPPSYEYLSTSNRYSLLAGQLIWDGQVDASHCADNGLLPNRAASTCGETAAVEQVLAVQNQYDPAIFQAALDYRLPPKLLKGLLGQESQFWPLSDTPGEYGLARLTDHGLDMLLTWNLPFYLTTCRETLSDPVCSAGYDSLDKEKKAMLRGAAYTRIGTPQEIALIAQTIKAGCAQVAQLGENILGGYPGAYFTYEDLWTLSLATFHSGAGCVGEALEAAYHESQELSWPVVAGYLKGTCQSAIHYVERVFFLAR